MEVSAGKIARLLLASLLLMAVFMPSAGAAGGQIGLVFNGQDFQADLYLENGVSYISTASLGKIPGLTSEGDGYVPLRDFFASQGGTVNWDKEKQSVAVSWRDKNNGWSADDLVIESGRLLIEKNSYKMKGSATIEMSILGPPGGVAPETIEMTSFIEGAARQEPLAVYVKQTMELPQGLPGQGMDINEESALPLPDGMMCTEMVWAEGKIYQKTPLAEQWIVQDLAVTGMMENLTNMLQASPQKALEMMREFGILYVFGDDVEIDGQGYYTISNYIDSATFKKILTEYLAEWDLAGLAASPDGTFDQEVEEEGAADFAAGLDEIFQQLLKTIKIDYYVDTYVNKDTLLTDRMAFDMDMEYGLDETLNPEGAISIKMNMCGDFKLYDFGTGVQLPDLEDAITQQEFMEKMFKEGMLNNTETAE